MIIVTGGAGFIGSNIVHRLNALGRDDIIVVDDLTNGRQFVNIATAKIADYYDKEAFLKKILAGEKFAEKIEVIFHEGACSATTEWNGKYMMENNFTYSKQLLHYAQQYKIQFIYASSAAVYGGEERFVESDTMQRPLNVYGYSKWLFDQYVLKMLPDAKSQVGGLRYFNVFGPRENHKGNMASVAYHFTNQLYHADCVRLFEGWDGYANGEQKRDFVYVEDCVSVNLWMYEHPSVSGIYNCGTGLARSFNDVAKALLSFHGRGEIEYIPFPEQLKGAYQSFTEANTCKLIEAGYEQPFHSLEAGLEKYFQWLSQCKEPNSSTL